MPNPTIKSYLEAGVQFTEMSKKQAESLVKALVKSGDVRRKDAEELVQSLVARGRETTEKISALVHSEVAKQMAALSGSVRRRRGQDRIADRVTEAQHQAVGAAALPAT